jgi:hypothetical protein
MLIAIASTLLVPGPSASAAGTTCGNGGGWCSGSDTNTRYNTAGNNPQIYLGEVGIYFTDFGGRTQCNGPYGNCFNTAAADAAKTRFINGTGLGTQFYYFGGGPMSQYEPQWGSNYCFGWEQGYKAVHHANDSYGTYYNSALLMFFDVEQGATSEWSTNSQADRQVYNGFVDYVAQRSSADPTHCNNKNGILNYQYGVYSAPGEWNPYFGTSAYNTTVSSIIWTHEYCCNASWPGNFSPSSTRKAQWFANGYFDGWQFDEGPDYDIFKEPMWLPVFNFSFGS